MSPLDSWFLQVERSTQQLHVGSALLFAGPPPSYDDLCATITARLDRAPRYRQRFRRVPLELGRPVWVDDVHFRIDHHVLRAALPTPGSESQLRELAGRIMSQSLDLTRPLWEMWLVEGLADGRWALLNKSHHALMDGISGTDLMGVVLDRRKETKPPAASTWQPRPEPSAARLISSALGDTARVPLRQTANVALALATPTHLLRDLAAEVGGLAALGRRAIRWETVLDGPIGPHRSWGWARSNLRDVKAVKNALGGTVNDVVLAVISGAFRTFLLERGEQLDGRTIRTMVPVSMRQPGATNALGNQLSAVFADLPVGMADPVERLRSVTGQLSGLKAHGMAMGVETMLDATELFPPTLFALGARMSARLPQRSVSTVTTNVPGPQTPLFLLGHAMLEMFPYIPLALDVRITIGIVSYDGHITYGVTGDADNVPDLGVLCDGIDAATEELVTAGRAAGAGRVAGPGAGPAASPHPAGSRHHPPPPLRSQQSVAAQGLTPPAHPGADAGRR